MRKSGTPRSFYIDDGGAKPAMSYGPIMARSTHRRFVNYIDRSRAFYAAKGFENPYGWATGNPVAFTAPVVAAKDATVALVTTATPPGGEPRTLGRFDASTPPTTMGTDHLSWHKDATTTDDVGSFLPLDHLRRLERDGEIGAVGPHYYATATLYSHRRILENATQLVDWLRDDGVDVVILAGL